MVSVRRRPLMIAATRSPGPKPCASRKTSLATTSSGRAGSGQVPRRSDTAFSSGSPRSGSDTSRPVAGSSMPGTSSVTSATTRVSTRTTPGRAAMRGASRSGARAALANTSAKRWRW